EEAIAAAHREAVGLADGAAVVDLEPGPSRRYSGGGPRCLVSRHGLDDLQLLPILFTEDAPLWLDEIEQPGDDLADTGEVARPDGVLQARRRGDARERRNRDVHSRRVHLIDGRGEDNIGARGAAGFQVSVERSWVPREVLVG